MSDDALRVEAMSTDERSLLLYLETRAVDYYGKVDLRRVNADDLAIAKRWAESGFIAWGRLPSAMFLDAKTANARNSMQFVVLSATAWNMAHRERCNRAARMRATLMDQLRDCEASVVRDAALKAYEEAD